MKTLTYITVGLTLLVHSAHADAQGKRLIEMRAGAAFPTQNSGGNDFGTGAALEVTFTYPLSSVLGVYAGWGWVNFNPDQSFAGSDVDFEETGYTFGLRVEQPLHDGSKMAWWLRAGGTFDHIELENASGDLVADSGHGLGLEAAAGVAVTLSDQWRLTPGLRYSALSRDLEGQSATAEIDLRYAALEIGLARAF